MCTFVLQEPQTSAGRRPRRKRARLALEFEDIETESPASISDDDDDSPLLSGKGRGRGRGRGRGKGRGGRRGGRVFRGLQFQDDEEEHLVRLHEEREEAANVNKLNNA